MFLICVVYLIINLIKEDFNALSEENKNLLSKLYQTTKLAKIGELSANVTHEINNPLTIILGNISIINDLLSTTYVNKQKIKNALEKLENSVERINVIVNGFKNFSRASIEENNYTTHCHEVINSSVSLIKKDETGFKCT